MIAALTVAAAGFTAPLYHMPYTTQTTVRRVTMKAEVPDDDDKPQVHLESIGSVVEFDDGKHDRSLLGIVTSAEAKAKGGARYSVIDANSVTHSVPGKGIHCSFSADKKMKDGVDPNVLLEPFEKIQALPSTNLGVEPDILELAWEMLKDEDKSSWSAKTILRSIDDSMCRSPVEQYRAFRLLTSDLGHIFFKSLSDNMFKPKNDKAVKASKENWCRSHDELDYCLL
jgi:hypothetical protein